VQKRESLLTLCSLVLAALLAIEISANGQTSGQVESPDAALVTLDGHIPAVAKTRGFDRGPVDPDLPLDHLQLLLRRSAEQEKAMESALTDLQSPESPDFHRWMTAAEIGRRFGASDSELAQVTDWLRSHGLRVDGIDSTRTVVQFSGTAGLVQDALHTQIHYLAVAGRTHIAPVAEPRVPASIARLVRGVPLTDFQPHPLHRDARSLKLNPETGRFEAFGPPIPGESPAFVIDSTLQFVSPGDFAKIYNLSPVWSEGYRGKGQTIAVVEDTLMKGVDVGTFRRAFGLSRYAGTFTQEAPVGAHPCENAGITGNEGEAALDAEWAGATAPDAAIVLAACADTRTQFGGLIALQNLLSQQTPPETVSISYGMCEAEMGAITVNQYASTYQQAVAEGVSVFVSSGDEGAASCDADESYALNGINTSGFATTPYNVSVGGTDFFDYIQGSGSEYWAVKNGSNYVTALSYVPEKTWNDSCADSDLLTFLNATRAYGAKGFCNNSTGRQYVTTASGSGGPSAIYLKPSWQNVYGVPRDGLRDIPDVSLFASNGFWGHALVYCNSDIRTRGAPCSYTNADDTVVNAAGGTSFASPALAGIFALITQKYGRQGNPDPGLYALAAQEYGIQSKPIAANLAACNATLGNTVDAACTFHDVTHGSIDVPCLGASCYGWSISPEGDVIFGSLSASTETFQSAYPTAKGWDFATGLGSVNVENLFANWASVMTGSTKIR
jgi:subtilase family serine protease